MVAAVGRRAGHEHRKRDKEKDLWMKFLYQNLTMLIDNFVVEGLVLHRGLAVM